MKPLVAPTLEEIGAARRRLEGLALRTPLVALNETVQGKQVFLKLENLQPIGSFKIRGAGNALHLAAAAGLPAAGVFTASAGNMAQGLAYAARRLGIACAAVVPDNAPATKLAAIERLGARTIKIPFDEWWQVLVEHRRPGQDGHFIHPVSHPDVLAGNATIGLEVIDDLPDVDTVLIPFGGGGLSCGIASALRALRPEVRILACEVETAAPLASSLAAGEPRSVSHTRSFVDGIGGKSVLAEMWPLASRLLDGAITVSLEEVAAAIRLLAERNHVIAEGAGAASLAAALSGKAGGGKLACIISGGNIDAAKLAAILAGELPLV